MGGPKKGMLKREAGGSIDNFKKRGRFWSQKRIVLFLRSLVPLVFRGGTVARRGGVFAGKAAFLARRENKNSTAMVEWRGLWKKSPSEKRFKGKSEKKKGD